MSQKNETKGHKFFLSFSFEANCRAFGIDIFRLFKAPMCLISPTIIDIILTTAGAQNQGFDVRGEAIELLFILQVEEVFYAS